MAADCVLLTTLALLLRLAWLGRDSLWIDELFSVHWSRLPLAFLLGRGAWIETNPPGYYVLLHGWMALFGTGEAAVRLPSVLASAATVPVVYALGRMAGGRTAGALAGLLFALNPVSIAYAQEARGYALSALLAGLCLLALRRCQDHAAAGAPHRTPYRSRLGRPFAGFVLMAIAAAWVHYTALLFIAACFAAAGLHLLVTRPVPWRSATVWTGAALLTAIALAPLLPRAAALSGSNNLVWIPPLSLKSVLHFFLALLVALPPAGPFAPAAWAALGLLGLIVALTWPRLRALGVGFTVPALVALLYCGLLIAASAVRPMLLARVATWLVIPLCLVLALAIVVQPSRGRRVAAGLWPLLVVPAGLMCHVMLDRREDWRGAAHLAATDPRCAGPVLIGGFNALAALQYGLYGHRPVLVFLPDPRRRDSVELRLSQRLMHLPELTPAAVPGFVAGHPGAAVVMRDGSVAFLPPPLRSLLDHAPFRPDVEGLAFACF